MVGVHFFKTYAYNIVMADRRYTRERKSKLNLALRAGFSIWLALAGTSLPVSFVQAAEQIVTVPFETAQAVVWVLCDQRQGSGTVINGEAGYVLTNAHVARDVERNLDPKSCTVGFLADPNEPPVYFYEATVIHSIFSPGRDQDFAILRIGQALNPQRVLPRPFPSVKTFEFPTVSDQVQLYGFSLAGDHLRARAGTVENFSDGFIQTSAPIYSGDSGGAGLDSRFRLIGMPTRIVTLTREGGAPIVKYEIVDIRAVMNWLDTFGTNQHDAFFTHADPVRYHSSAVFINQTSIGCDFLGRSLDSSSVFCFMPGGERLVFPNAKTFLSWFGDFSLVEMVDSSSLAQFRITRNVTFKPGSLVKSATSPRTFVVVDSYGTLRWIPSEAKAIQLWGPNWANLISDIPDEFWINYSIGQPLDG